MKNGKSPRIAIIVVLISILIVISICSICCIKLFTIRNAEKEIESTASECLPESESTAITETESEPEIESETEQEPEPEMNPDPASISGKFRGEYENIRENYSDCIGWIYCENTPINYPIMYSDDNEKYLRKNIDLEYSKAGCIFLDHRNISDFSDFFNVIYGHNLLTDKMFGTLTKYKKKAYYESHPELWIFLPEKDLRLSVIGVIKTKVPNTTLYNFNTGEEDKETYLDYIESERMYEIEYDRADVEGIILLSTCTNVTKSERCVIVCSSKEDIMTEDDVNGEED